LVGADERKMEKAKEAMLALSRGWERSAVEELVADVLIRVIDPFVYQEAIDLIALHRALGRRVYIVSSSPEEVVRPLAAHFDITDVIATRAEVVDGKYTGELAFYCYGEGKADAIREVAEQQRIDLERSYAYSDSITDLPMLNAVGHPVAVNPDRDLRREAEAKGWQIRDFRRPVRLRTRLASVPRPPTPIAAAVAAAVAAIIVGWIFLRPRGERATARDPELERA
jgi:HAD superfamily hydrolase (TIGR01490 family)